MSQPSAIEFLDTVRNLLIKHRRDWKRIAYHADVSEQWMGLITSHKSQNPGYGTLMRTYNALMDIEAEEATE